MGIVGLRRPLSQLAKGLRELGIIFRRKNRLRLIKSRFES